MPTRFNLAFLGLSVAGIALAVYHAYDELTSYEGPGTGVCNVSRQISCQSVFAYSHPFGVPLYILGIFWFPLLLVLTIWMRPYINTALMLPLLMVGNIFTIYLWFVELDIAGAICPICVSMYFVNYALTILAIIAAI